ncbi:hypothetical protein ACIHFB_44670 [Streptomyces sp. NPDC051963]|uniref:hypothetical protein n=1 Tax=Streptomyces sp. NPDC051963 TaxID=3365678 RepID=UPI0037D62172
MTVQSGNSPGHALHRLRPDTVLPIDLLTTHSPARQGRVLPKAVLRPRTDAQIRGPSAPAADGFGMSWTSGSRPCSRASDANGVTAADIPRSGRHLALQAGTGRTSTLCLVAADTKRRGCYVDFHQDIARSAAARFPYTVHCRTAHATALAALSHRYAKRLNSPRKPDWRTGQALRILRSVQDQELHGDRYCTTQRDGVIRSADSGASLSLHQVVCELQTLLASGFGAHPTYHRHTPTPTRPDQALLLVRCENS